MRLLCRIEVRLSHALLVCGAIINGRKRSSLEAQLRFKIYMPLHCFWSRQSTPLLLLEKLARCGACKHAAMDCGSTLILCNHSDDLFYLLGIVKHRWFAEGPALFILGRVSPFFR
jgi:hypothetical protein